MRWKVSHGLGKGEMIEGESGSVRRLGRGRWIVTEVLRRKSVTLLVGKLGVTDMRRMTGKGFTWAFGSFAM